MSIRGSASFSRKNPHHGVSHLDVTEQWFRNLGNCVFRVLVTDVEVFEYVSEIPSMVSMKDGNVIVFIAYQKLCNGLSYFPISVS